MLKHSVHSLAGLVEQGLINEEKKSELDEVVKRYPISLTSTVLKLISPNETHDPIALQFLPRPEELLFDEKEMEDPIGDYLKSPVKGIVHRHTDRVLFKVIGVCPVYCRFCFRREMIGPQNGENLTEHEIESALEYIRGKPQIWEIILTGGDPFMLSERRIGILVERINTLPHVKVVRWHTRVPFVSPQNVTPQLIKNLTNTSKSIVIGLHVNHPKEFSAEANLAIRSLREAGLTLVSQSVLLSGVNDSAETLEKLMRLCLEAGILPYYLHHPDLAPGTQHFRVSITRGLDIMKELQGRISSLICPDYVLDLPGAYGKISLLSSKVRSYEEFYLIEDNDGRVHTYCDALSK